MTQSWNGDMWVNPQQQPSCSNRSFNFTVDNSDVSFNPHVVQYMIYGLALWGLYFLWLHCTDNHVCQAPTRGCRHSKLYGWDVLFHLQDITTVFVTKVSTFRIPEGRINPYVIHFIAVFLV